MKEKTKKNIKDAIKDIVALVCIIGLIFGGYKLYMNYKSGLIGTEDSYKVKTEKNTKYNGVYSLTKLDENGNNTWNGLMLYVKKDKIVSCANIEYTSMEEIKKQFGDKVNQLNDEEDIFWQAEELGVKINLPKSGSGSLKTGFAIDGGGISEVNKNDGVLTGSGQFICMDKVNFDTQDIKNDYDYMKSCDIIPGYDEDNQEVWLSKLLSNEKSTYHEGYKLIHYTNGNDIQKNCKLDNGSCIRKLNEYFNAGLN